MDNNFVNEAYYRSASGQSTVHQPTQDNNTYEHVNLDKRRIVQPVKAAESAIQDTPKRPAWSKPIIVLTILLSLILALLVTILCLLIALIFVKPVSDASATELSVSDWPCNFTGLIDGVIYDEKLPNFTQWANDVVDKVNTTITKTFPQWADHVVHNIRKSFPNFTQQTNDVVHRVNTNVTLGIHKFSELDTQILQTTSKSAQDLNEVTNTLANVTTTLANVSNILSILQDISTSTAGVVDDVLVTARGALAVLDLMLSNFLPTSCKQIFNQFPNSPSGYYVLAAGNGSTNYSAYCNMEELCGSGGGWTRVSYLNMTDSTQNCPSGFRMHEEGGVRACGRQLVPGCASVQFSSNGICYSQICGRVRGYQYGSTNVAYNNPYANDINSYYIDGVSITRGSPRQHVWTLMAGFSEIITSSYACPCNTGGTVPVQSFIGNNYFCESGNMLNSASSNLYPTDPLWDGHNCRQNEVPCCSAPGIPWFHRDYGRNTTTDYIELRVCGSDNNEDNPVDYYEVYVK